MEVRERGENDLYHRESSLQILPTLGTTPEIEKKRKLDRCRKKQLMTPAESRPWAALPKELLEIFSKSNSLSIADFLSFGKVCRNWRLSYLETKSAFMASRPPLVIYISTRAKRSCYFYEIKTSPNTYKTKLPNFARNFCIGLSNGYLIMEDIFTNVWVINPITGHKLKFPRLFETPNFLNCSDRAVFASIGDDAKDNFLLAVLAPTYKTLMFFVSRVNQWQQFSYIRKNWSIIDIVVFGGRVFCITSENQIGVLSVKTCEVILLNLKNTPQLRSIWPVRFVASKNQLLIVDFPREGNVLEVYTIDLLKMEWVKVNQLRDKDEAIFLGEKMSSRLSNATNWGGQSNCIYYLPFKHNTCYIYSIRGESLGSFPIMKQKAAPKMNGWFFPGECFTLENVRDE
ncbi:uncharacterized protein LOC123208590 [Mangifera indica]|uniref:uncharacterized protein LOC123208590 n=1 Tax=Mangifera indica TaxID=29780 RepID=UPI001CFB1798|nr:uncharacterized protein LOC123208590 [Mangifera indica]